MLHFQHGIGRAFLRAVGACLGLTYEEDGGYLSPQPSAEEDDGIYPPTPSGDEGCYPPRQSGAYQAANSDLQPLSTGYQIDGDLLPNNGDDDGEGLLQPSHGEDEEECGVLLPITAEIGSLLPINAEDKLPKQKCRNLQVAVPKQKCRNLQVAVQKQKCRNPCFDAQKQNCRIWCAAASHNCIRCGLSPAHDRGDKVQLQSLPICGNHAAPRIKPKVKMKPVIPLHLIIPLGFAASTIIRSSNTTLKCYDVKIMDDTTLSVDGKQIKVVSNRDFFKLLWADMGIDIVIEGTGVFVDGPHVGKHIQADAKKVIITAPAKGANIPTYVVGVNEGAYSHEVALLFSVQRKPTLLLTLFHFTAYPFHSLKGGKRYVQVREMEVKRTLKIKPKLWWTKEQPTTVKKMNQRVKTKTEIDIFYHMKNVLDPG